MHVCMYVFMYVLLLCICILRIIHNIVTFFLCDDSDDVTHTAVGENNNNEPRNCIYYLGKEASDVYYMEGVHLTELVLLLNKLLNNNQCVRLTRRSQDSMWYRWIVVVLPTGRDQNNSQPLYYVR